MVGPRQTGTRSELLLKLWAGLSGGCNTYNYFQYRGRLGAPPIPEYVNPFLRDGYCFSKLTLSEQGWFIQQMGDYCYTFSTRKTLDVSVRKMDHLPCVDFLQDVNFGDVHQYLKFKWREPLVVSEMTPNEILEDFDLNKAPGYFETWRGYRTKADCIVAGLLDEFTSDSLLLETPIWKVTGKNEIKETELYVGEFKQRTFIIEPMSMLWQDKRVFGHQNSNLKAFWWSSYGFNPYEGGVQNMANKLSNYQRKWEWDVKGYDRLFPHMKYVQEVRTQDIPPTPFRDWVVKHKIESLLVLPNGDVIFKTWGNNSGSGTTTTDNIIGMSYPIMHSFLRMGLSFEDVDRLVTVFIFGDDVLGGDNINISDIVFREVIVGTFRLYGYELDPFVISNEVEGMTFLGFSIHEIEPKLFVPQYKLPRLCYSFAKSLSRKIEIDKELSKMISLMLMSAGHGESVYNNFRVAIATIVVRTSHPFCTRLLRYGIDKTLPSYADTISWYCGTLEGLKIFQEVDGIKEIFISWQKLSKPKQS